MNTISATEDSARKSSSLTRLLVAISSLALIEDRSVSYDLISLSRPDQLTVIHGYGTSIFSRCSLVKPRTDEAAETVSNGLCLSQNFDEFFKTFVNDRSVQLSFVRKAFKEKTTYYWQNMKALGDPAPPEMDGSYVRHIEGSPRLQPPLRQGVRIAWYLRLRTKLIGMDLMTELSKRSCTNPAAGISLKAGKLAKQIS